MRGNDTMSISLPSVLCHIVVLKAFAALAGRPATAAIATWARINRVVVSEANVVDTLILAALLRMAQPSAFQTYIKFSLAY